MTSINGTKPSGSANLVSKTERKIQRQAKLIPGTDRPVKVKGGVSLMKYPRIRPLYLAPLKPGKTQSYIESNGFGSDA